jgi:hypothetical protein
VRAVVAYLPSPLEVAAVKGSEVDNPDVALTRKPDDSEPFSALAFKIMADQFVGSLTFLRIYRCASIGNAPCLFATGVPSQIVRCLFLSFFLSFFLSLNHRE